jgi:hypothetical protein
VTGTCWQSSVPGNIFQSFPPGSLVTTVDSLLTDALRARYLRERGRGGMATVYLAHDLKHDRPVALKVLHWELAALVPERFLREIHDGAAPAPAYPARVRLQ